MAAEMWANMALPVPRLLGHQAQCLTQQFAERASAPITSQKSYRKRKIVLSFQMKQLSTSDRQGTGRVEAIGAENKLWSFQGNRDSVSVSKPMYCFVDVFKMKKNVHLSEWSKYLLSQGCGTRQGPHTDKWEGTW